MVSSMRLLHVTHQYPPAIGGSERYIADLSEELVSRGHQVDVFTSQSRDFYTWRSELPGFERREGVNVYRYRSLQRRGYIWRMLHFGLRNYWRTRAWWYEPFIFLGGGPLCPRMFWMMLLRGRQYDLIHLNCLVYAHVTYGYWVAQILNKPVVVTPHAHAEQEVTYNIGYQRAVLEGCDHILVDTAAERDLFVDLGISPERISLGGVGLHPAKYPIGDVHLARQDLGLPQDKFIIMFLGRKDKYKGVEIALQAFVEIQAEHPDVYFLAVGPETAYSRSMWADYRQIKNLRVLGAVNEKDKIAALQACDCMVLPSVGEAFGIVFLEAWMMGKPVIGARTLAVSAVVDEGQDGLLAAPNDVFDLARCIAYLVEHPDYSRDMGKKGREKVLSCYTVPRITDRLENVYRDVLESANDG